MSTPPRVFLTIAALLFLSPVLCAASLSDIPAKEFFFTQTIDHFNWRRTSTGASTYQQRFFVNDTYWTKGGPVLFYSGNEANIEVFIENTGAMFDWAPQLGALIVFAEHRYYGASVPFGSVQEAFNLDNIGYLTVEQAIADFSTLIVYIRSQWEIPETSAVIAIGGSYGANLALWLRTKQPNLFAGAIASSNTPLKSLLRESNCFAHIVTQVYANVSARCPDLMRQGWASVNKLAATDEGRAQLAAELGLCAPPSASPSAAPALINWIRNGVETMVQYGYPYPSAFDNPLPGKPYSVACHRMLDDGTPLGALRAAIDVYYNYTGAAGVCYDTGASTAASTKQTQQHSRGLEGRRQFPTAAAAFEASSSSSKASPSPSPSPSLLGDQSGMAWGYQTCSEVYQPMPTNGVTDMYWPYTPNNTAIFAACDSTWAVTPRPDWEELHFWGAAVGTASNLFLTTGQLDPWRSSAVTAARLPRGANPSIVAREMEGAAHHLDLRASNPLDPPSVVKVRQEEAAAMKQWALQWAQDHQ